MPYDPNDPVAQAAAIAAQQPQAQPDDSVAQAAQLGADDSGSLLPVKGQPSRHYKDWLASVAARGAAGPSVDPTPLAPPAQSMNDVASQPIPTGSAPGAIVPQFTPPENPAAPIHKSFMERLSNTLAGIPQAQANLLSPNDLAQAHSRTWLAVGNSLLNPTLDARGFKQSFLGSLASGIQNGQQAGEQSAGGALQAQQYATGLAQQQRINAARASVAHLWEPQPGDALDREGLTNRLAQGVFALTAAGDDKGATALDGLVKGLREGRISAAQAFQYQKGLFGRIIQIDKSTGQAKPVYVDPNEGFVKDARTRALNTASDNSLIKDQSMYNNGPGKEFAKARSAYDNFDAVADELQGVNGQKPNPAALRKFVSAFGQAAAPQIQYRLGTLMYEEPLDVSLRGQLQSLASRMEAGSLPPDQVEQARKLVATLRARTMSREAEVARAFAKKSPHGFGAVRTDLNPQFENDGSQDGANIQDF